MIRSLTDLRKLLTALFFIVLIATPLLLHLTARGSTDSNIENRRLAPPPQLSGILSNWTSFPEEANAWMRDHFGLRRTYLKLGFLLDKSLLSPTTYKAVQGDEGWIFLTVDGALAQHRGLLPFAGGDADRWLDGLVEVQAAAQASGATFLAMIAPNKHTIYPEHLSAYPQQVPGETRLEEVQRRAVDRDLPLIDLRDALLDAKAQDKVYYQTDSHWTELGAHSAYVELRAALAERGIEISEIERNQLSIRKKEDFRGDLYPLLGIEEGAPEVAEMIVIDSSQIGPKAGSILFIGDSFTHQLRKYLEAGFERVVYEGNHGGKPALDVIASDSFDVVVYQVVERYLSKPFRPVASAE